MQVGYLLWAGELWAVRVPPGYKVVFLGDVGENFAVLRERWRLFCFGGAGWRGLPLRG